MATPNSQTFDERKIIGRAFYREVELNERSLKVDREKRTFQIAFSSEYPVRRWYGYEILDHSGKGADLKRLNSGAALLLCHDRNQQVGAVVKKTAKIGEDKKGRAECRVSRSRDDILDDLEDEIRGPASFGYIPKKMKLEEKQLDGVDVYRIFEWEAIEISLEPTPGDPTVGVGRSLEDTDDPETETILDATRVAEPLTPKEEERTMETLTPTPAAAAPPPMSEEVTRTIELVAMGEALGDVEMARTVATEGGTIADLRTRLIAKRKAATPDVPAEDPAVVAARNGGGSGAVQVIARHGKLKNFKGEGADLRAYRCGMWGVAALLGRNNDSAIAIRAREYCKTNGIPLTRAATEGINEDGGFNVPTEFGNDIIDNREEFGVLRPNIKVVPMASDSKTQPVREGGLTLYAVGEGKAITESKKRWGQILLVAKKWGVLTKVSSELNEDSVVSWADDMVGEVAAAIAEGEDEIGFNADGTSTYHGISGIRARLRNPERASSLPTIANIAGLVVASGNLFSEFTLNDFIAVMGRLPKYAKKRGMPKWYVAQEVWANTMVRVAAAAGGVTATEVQNAIVTDSPRFLSYPVEITEVMPDADANSQISVIFGSLNLGAMLGDRRGVTIAMSDSDGDDFASDILALRATTRFDINVHSVGNVSATANLRKPGPIVGLISAAS
jgi:HK97 family phage major capsid protein